MTDNPYGPDKPCQRSLCVAVNQYAEQDARDRAIAAGHDPVDVHADPLPTVGDHLGGAHLDPRDREHYDGISTSYNAMPLSVKKATAELINFVEGFDRRISDGDDTPLRTLVEVALDGCFDEIDRLRQQVAHVQVDADRRERAAHDAALDCEHHGEQIRRAGELADAWARQHDRAEKARLTLLGFLTTVDDWLDQRREATAAGARHDVHADEIANALAKASARTHAAHKRAWNG